MPSTSPSGIQRQTPRPVNVSRSSRKSDPLGTPLPDHFVLPRKNAALIIKSPVPKREGTRGSPAICSNLPGSLASKNGDNVPFSKGPGPISALVTANEIPLPAGAKDQGTVHNLSDGQQGPVNPRCSDDSGIKSNQDSKVSPTRIRQSQVDAEPSKSLAAKLANQSKLSIYASVHVPDWLNGINESNATRVMCLPLLRFDPLRYAAMFGANVLIQPHEQRTQSVDESPEAVSSDLDHQSYLSHFNASLSKEFTALMDQLMKQSLYQQPLVLKNADQLLYEVAIPGLRENAPRLDLGDIVLVRLIRPMPPASAFRQNQMWRESLQFNGLQHPAFTGLEYHAVVWALSRPRETVLLRIDTQGSCPPTANIRFVLQNDKTEPHFRAVSSTAAALPYSAALRSMLFPTGEDSCMQTKLLPVAFNIDWKDDNLNFEQMKAVAAVISDKYGNVPYLISGPPGTGKTKTIVETALQLLGRKKSGVQPHLLVCAPSDSAADTLALRLSRHLNKDELFRLNGWTRTFAEVPDALMLNSFTEDNMFSLPPFRQIMSYSVVVTTCRDASMLVEARLTNKDLAQMAFTSLRAVSPTAAANLTTPILHWTALFLDEAAQATEPESLIPLSVVLPIWKIPTAPVVHPQFVLAGDEYQLGPRLASRTEKTGLEISLFQRLISLPFYADHPLSRTNGLQPLTRKLLPLPRPPFTHLVRNYRSQSAILSVPSALFYYDTLIPESNSDAKAVLAWPRWRRSGWPVLFVQNNLLDEVEDVLAGDGTGVGSLYNEGETRIVLDHVHSLLDQTLGLKPEEIVVMSPFRAQVGRIRIAMRQAGLSAVNVGPLEAFQGLECRIVVLCTTRTRRGGVEDEARFVKMDQARGLGVVDEPKQFNVAITRAMEGLIVIGDARTLVCTGDKCWKTFIAFCARNGLVRGDISAMEAEISAWGLEEGRLERALRRKEIDVGAEASGRVIGLRGFVEQGEEEGEMTALSPLDEDSDDVESDEEPLGDAYSTLKGLDLDGAVM